MSFLDIPEKAAPDGIQNRVHAQPRKGFSSLSSDQKSSRPAHHVGSDGRKHAAGVGSALRFQETRAGIDRRISMVQGLHGKPGGDLRDCPLQEMALDARDPSSGEARTRFS
jgi:hypothetical protein